MNKNFITLAAICSLLPALAFAEPTPAPPPPPPGSDMPMADGPHRGPGPRMGGRHHRGDMQGQGFSPRERLMRLLDYVKATDAQKKQVEELLKTNEAKIRDSFKAERDIRRELHRIGFSADYSDDKVKALLAKMQPAHEQAALEKARLDNAIFKLLTPEQQKQLQERISRDEPPMGPPSDKPHP